MDEKALREVIAATLARYASNAFSDTHAKCLPVTARFPDDYGAGEVGCFRTLAAHIMDDVRPYLQKTDNQN